MLERSDFESRVSSIPGWPGEMITLLGGELGGSFTITDPMGVSPSVIGLMKTAGVELGEGKREGRMMIRAFEGVGEGLSVGLGLGLSLRPEGLAEKEGRRNGAAVGELDASWVKTGTGVREAVAEVSLVGLEVGDFEEGGGKAGNVTEGVVVSLGRGVRDAVKV